MYECLKCNKKFKYDSEYNRHKNKKIPCDKKKMNCNVKYVILNL